MTDGNSVRLTTVSSSALSSRQRAPGMVRVAASRALRISLLSLSVRRHDVTGDHHLRVRTRGRDHKFMIIPALRTANRKLRTRPRSDVRAMFFRL